MKLSPLIFFLLLSLRLTADPPIKDLYLTSCNPDIGTKDPLLYFRGEGITIMKLQGNFPDGNYRIYDASDSTLAGYIELKRNKLDGFYIVFDKDKSPAIVGMKRRNKTVGTWLFFAQGRCECVKRFDNTICNVDFYPFTSIRFYNKREDVIWSINPKKIANPEYH